MLKNWQSGKHTRPTTISLLHTTKSIKIEKDYVNKRLATKTVADWELQVVVSRAEPVRITF